MNTTLDHPGGHEITRKAFNICGLQKSAKVLDIGCGYGDTAAYLEDEYGFSVTGIDKSAETIIQTKQKHSGLQFMEGNGQCLEFESLTFDCVLIGCTLSLMQNPAKSMREAFRVLKEKGYLIIHDLYVSHPVGRSFEVNSAHVVNGALILSDISAVLDELGFEVILFEDRESDLHSFAAMQIFHGKDINDYVVSKKSKCKTSYFLMVARKRKQLRRV